MDTEISDPLVGRLLDGRYRVGSRVARGGMATVYEALDTRLDRVVALKVMNSGLGTDTDFARKFVHEARSAARLSHQNVVAVFDQGSDDDTLFLAMEYVPGQTLREVIRDSAPMPPAKALDLLGPILSALSAAHDAGIVHRDIKPENVLIATDGKVKVADFGLSRAVSANGNTVTQGLLMGTVSYLAPELVTDSAADARSDVYSAGIVLYEMLTGEKPHTGETPIQVAYRHVHADVPPPSARQPGIPPYVDALVQRATSRSREHRPADAHVFAQQVRRVRSALDEGLPDDPDLTGDLTVPILALQQGLGDPGPFDDSPRYDADGPGVRTDTVVVEHEPLRVAAPPPPSRVARPTAPVRRRRRGPLALLLVLLLAAGVGTAAWYYGVQRYTKTPDLTGITAAQAASKAQLDGLTTTVAGQAFSETEAPGTVLSTDPGIGDRILKNGEVELTVSKGKERYKIPRLAGADASVARDTLARLNLVIGSETEKYSETVAAGKVIASSPVTGTVVKRGHPVNLTISRGQQPIEVPNTTGQRVRDATKTLRGIGFTVAITEQFSESVPRGRVISQNPNSGEAFRKDRIQLVVSKGPQLVRVPSVWRMNAKDARTVLERAGFKVKVQRAALYVGVNIVAAQDPAGNTMARNGTTVTITVL